MKGDFHAGETGVFTGVKLGLIHVVFAGFGMEVCRNKFTNSTVWQSISQNPAVYWLHPSPHANARC